MPGQLHGIALAQLAPYQEAARTWPRYPDGRAVRCGKCDQSMLMTADIQGREYHYTEEDFYSPIVAHIRQNHSEVVNGNE